LKLPHDAQDGGQPERNHLALRHSLVTDHSYRQEQGDGNENRRA
jgi:hypothetical protein